jgi:Glycosyl hydrolase family 99
MTRLALALCLISLLVPAWTTAAGQRVPSESLAGQTSIFYYPWYGTPGRDGGYLHWDQGGHVPPLDLASTYYPARGPYSSSDPRVVRVQMREIASAGIQEVVSSWWGWGSIEDRRLPLVVRAAHAQGLQVAVQIEPYDDRSAESVETDIGHLRSLGIARFYVYRPFEIEDADWSALLARVTGVQVIAQTANVARAAAAGFSGIYTYDVVAYGPGTFGSLCARAHQLGLVCAPSVGPGYEALSTTGDTHARERRDGGTYDAMWQAAIDARADRVTITSYNEWHEGTQIEAALARLPRNLAAAGGPATSPVAQAYASYDGAYGLHGTQASRAYLTRTALWTALYRAETGAGRPQDALGHCGKNGQGTGLSCRS